jgi:hypothetical protein
MTVAVILIHLAASATIAKQMAACVTYVDKRHYELAGFIKADGAAEDAVRMVQTGEAEVVVVAFGGRDIAADVKAAGGRVEAVHPMPHVVEPPVPPPPPPPKSFPRSVVDLLRKMRNLGHSPSEIAKFIGEDTGDIRRLLNPPEN